MTYRNRGRKDATLNFPKSKTGLGAAGALCAMVSLGAIGALGLAPQVASAQPGGDVPAAYEAILNGARVPVPLNPDVLLTDEQKRRTSEASDRTYLAIINQVPRWEFPRRETYGDQGWVVIVDPSDPNKDVKLQGIRRGMEMLIDRGVQLPRNLRFFLHNGAEVDPVNRPLTIAFQRGPNWSPVANVIITSVEPAPNPIPNVLARISSSNFNGMDKTAITAIHEVGHILHERHAGEFFWTLRDLNKGIPPVPTQRIVESVSAYAHPRAKEFVAEVFAAQIIGMPVREDMWRLYRTHRGPPIPGVNASNTY